MESTDHNSLNEVPCSEILLAEIDECECKRIFHDYWCGYLDRTSVENSELE